MNRLVATLGLLVAIAMVIAIVFAAQSPTAPGAHGRHPPGLDATTVQRRDLVQSDTESGTIRHADSRTVYDRLTGTITWLPAVGQVIKPGQVLYRCNGAPVILMDGATPAYRNLRDADSDGEDILQLNRNLVALGFNPDGIGINDVWQPATTAGVEAFQESLGQPQTGELKLGQIAFLPHDRVISAVDASLGSTGSGASRPGTTGPQFVSLTEPRHEKRQRGSTAKTLAALRARLRAQAAQLRREQAKLKAEQAAARAGNLASSPPSNPPSNRGGSPGASNPGAGEAGAGSPVLQTTSTRLVVTVALDATKQSEARVGEKVTVELPNGDTVKARISTVSAVAQIPSASGDGGGGGGGGNGGNGSGGATIPVTIALRGRRAPAGLDQAAVSVRFARAVANDVLSVPVTALLATAGEGYAVQEATAPHTLIPVTTGLFAAGYVEIAGQGIHPGLAITDSQG